MPPTVYPPPHMAYPPQPPQQQPTTSDMYQPSPGMSIQIYVYHLFHANSYLSGLLQLIVFTH